MTEATIANLALALSKAQGEIKNATKDVENAAFKRGEKVSRYADLASVWDACREALAKNDIAVVQKVLGGPETVTVETVLAHKSGETISCAITGKPTKPDVQGLGSTITYLRRYSLASMVGVAPEDDDGNAASGVGDGQKASTKAEGAAKKAAEQQKPTTQAKPTGIFLDLGNGDGSHHASGTAFLDAMEAAMKAADDPTALFDLNSSTLHTLQSKAFAAKTPQGDAVAGRIKAIFDHVHAGAAPEMAP